MKFIKSKSSLIAKLIVNQIAFSFLGLFVSLPLVMINETLIVYAGIFSSLFYLTMIFSILYSEGQKDVIAARGNISTSSNFNGLVIAAVSYIPTIVIVITNFIIKVFFSSVNYANKIASLIDNIIIRVFLMGYYLGIEAFFATNFEIFMYLRRLGANFLIMLVIMPVVGGIAYSCGYNNIKLFKKNSKQN